MRSGAGRVSGRGQARRRGTRGGGGEQPSAPCAVRRPGEGAAGDGAREQPTPGRRFERRLRHACTGAAGRSVVGRGGAGRGPGARRRPRRRLGAPHGRGAPLSGPEQEPKVCSGAEGLPWWEVGGGGGVVGLFDFAAEAAPSCEQQNGTEYSGAYGITIRGLGGKTCHCTGCGNIEI